MVEGSAVYPGVVSVTLSKKRPPAAGGQPERRTFIQTELTIDGEAQLLGLVSAVGAALSESNFPWDALAQLFSEGQNEIEWPKAIGMLGTVAGVLPNVVVDSTCIFFGIFEFDEHNARNAEWEADRAFLRASLTFTTWVDIVKTFAEQNDYQRLAGPFGQALAQGAWLRTTPPAGPESETPTVI